MAIYKEEYFLLQNKLYSLYYMHGMKYINIAIDSYNILLYMYIYYTCWFRQNPIPWSPPLLGQDRHLGSSRVHRAVLQELSSISSPWIWQLKDRVGCTVGFDGKRSFIIEEKHQMFFNRDVICQKLFIQNPMLLVNNSIDQQEPVISGEIHFDDLGVHAHMGSIWRSQKSPKSVSSTWRSASSFLDAALSS